MSQKSPLKKVLPVLSRIKFQRNSSGLGEFLRSASVAAAIRSKAEETAANARRSGANVVTESGTTDRAVARVTVKDRRARLSVTRDGLLFRDALEAGLEIKRYFS